MDINFLSFTNLLANMQIGGEGAGEFQSICIKWVDNRSLRMRKIFGSSWAEVTSTRGIDFNFKYFIVQAISPALGLCLFLITQVLSTDAVLTLVGSRHSE